MLGKRITRVYPQKTAEPSIKNPRLSTPLNPPSSQTTELSKCPSPSNTQCTTQQDEPRLTQSQTNNYCDNKNSSKREIYLEMLRLLIDEFNCNHQADLDSDQQVQIFVRDSEQKTILKFIEDNKKKRGAALMYLCGHPGTGKTSSLNLVLSKLKEKMIEAKETSVEVFQYNAMTYRDMKSFTGQLVEEVHKRLTGQELKVNRQNIDDEKISNQIAQKLKNYKQNTHKILVIDEIDNFQSNEKAFSILIKQLIQSQCNTSIIGIANSVDLPFKKKDSALSLRQLQLLFKPYSQDQIIAIIEEKFFSQIPKLPKHLRVLTSEYMEVLDDQSIELIGRKVAKMNGDVRVAFDLIKACFDKLYYQVMHVQKEEQLSIQLKLGVVMKVFEEKYGSKVKEILQALPRQNLIVLEALVNLFDDQGEEKQLLLISLYDEVEKECKSRCLPKFDNKQILSSIEELEFYNLIEIERSKKELKNSKFWLKVELKELIIELDLLNNPEKAKQLELEKEREKQELEREKIVQVQDEDLREDEEEYKVL